jgi:hypothetical protein
MGESSVSHEEYQPLIPLDHLPDQLGFIEEYPKLGDVRVELVSAMKAEDWNAIKELKDRYQELAEQIINQRQGKEFAKAQIGLMIKFGLMWRDAGKLDSYEAELYNAHQYASNMGFDEAATQLQTAMAELEEIAKAARDEVYMGPPQGAPTEEIIAVCKRELPAELYGELDLLLSLPPDEVLDEVAALMIGHGLLQRPTDFFAKMG